MKVTAGERKEAKSRNSQDGTPSAPEDLFFSLLSKTQTSSLETLRGEEERFRGKLGISPVINTWKLDTNCKFNSSTDIWGKEGLLHWPTKQSDFQPALVSFVVRALFKNCSFSLRVWRLTSALRRKYLCIWSQEKARSRSSISTFRECLIHGGSVERKRTVRVGKQKSYKEKRDWRRKEAQESRVSTDSTRASQSVRTIRSSRSALRETENLRITTLRGGGQGKGFSHHKTTQWSDLPMGGSIFGEQLKEKLQKIWSKTLNPTGFSVVTWEIKSYINYIKN